MQINQVAAQLYTVREFCKTPTDIAETLRKVREIGYEAVQVSAIGPIAEEELASMLDGEGLICCATHEPTATILDEPERVVERLQKLNCRFTAVPSPGVNLETLDDVRNFAARINRAGEVLFRNDQVLAYHNHHMEFRRIDGWSILETIYAETDSNYLAGEIDTYWVQYGGGDVVDWCQRLQDRLPLIHLKDYAVDTNNTPVFSEIGYGNLNWGFILPAAEGAGCQWYIVEQDTCPGDPFDSLRLSFEFLRDYLENLEDVTEAEAV